MAEPSKDLQKLRDELLELSKEIEKLDPEDKKAILEDTLFEYIKNSNNE